MPKGRQRPPRAWEAAMDGPKIESALGDGRVPTANELFQQQEMLNDTMREFRRVHDTYRGVKQTLDEIRVAQAQAEREKVMRQALMATKSGSKRNWKVILIAALVVLALNWRVIANMYDLVFQDSERKSKR